MKYCLFFLIVIVANGFEVLANDNQCLKFYDNYAMFRSDPQMRPIEQITVECWVKPNKYTNWGAPISYLVDNRYNESGFALAFNEGKMRFMIKTNEMRSQDWTYNPGIVLEMNQWCHIAGVYDGISIKVYQNGILKEEKFVSGNIDWKYIPDQLSIGAFVDNNELHYFNGCVDEVRIWNRGLSENEIKKGMRHEFTGEEYGLLVYLPMTEIGSVIKDHSLNHYDGKFVNFTSDNRTTSLAMVQPKILQSKVLSSSSIKIDWKISNYSKPLDDFYIDMARDSKFNFIIPQFKDLKTNRNSFTFDNIPGGENLYVRIKGRDKNNEYCAYSDPFLISDFSYSLSIDLQSEGEENDNHFVILDDNVLATDYFKFKKGIRAINIKSTLTSKLINQGGSASIHVKGGGIDEVYIIDKVANLIFSDLKPGKYEIKLKWASENKEELENSFVIEIDKLWWHDIWFLAIVFILLSAFVYLLTQSIVVIKRKRYRELLDGYVPIPEKDALISEEEMTQYYNQLIDLMVRDKLFLEPRLSIRMLGDILDVSPNILSLIIQEKNGLYFNDFVNKYRVEEFKTLLKNKDTENLKISAIAYKCGFNSESTFFRVFKKFTGETPSSFQKNLG